MEPTYADRLRDALRPQTEPEHMTVNYLSAVTKLQAETLLGMIERRRRTAVRAARMHVARLALDGWKPDLGSPPDATATMEHLASGGDPEAGIEPEQVAASAVEYQRGFNAGIEHAAGVEQYEDVRTAVSLAYDRGWREGIEHAREQQLRGIDPELWDDR